MARETEDTERENKIEKIEKFQNSKFDKFLNFGGSKHSPLHRKTDCAPNLPSPTFWAKSEKRGHKY